ncbi:unnamed protein product [Peronospora farinosa]|uniref:Glucosylceramidase n=1 Tax=Peronospora farinosa TaxID=134698 RepID=A0AAV0U2Y7_9STRA|nr:unnamed protein product [Peronospora farinosa]
MANDDQKSRILDRSAPFDDPESKKYLSGVAFHWYQNLDFILPFVGSYKKLKKFYKAYPDMFMLGTEACEGYMPGFTGTGKGPALHNLEKAWKRAENYARDIIENSNSMAGGWVDWNLFLNTNGGPNWANNMPMYYIMGHFSKFVPPGSKRIKFSKTRTLHNFHHCAFVTPNNQIVMQFLNRGSSKVTISVKQTDPNTITLTLSPHSIHTLILPASEDTKIL